MTDGQKGRQTNKQTGKQTFRWAETQTDRIVEDEQIDIQIYKLTG